MNTGIFQGLRGTGVRSLQMKFMNLKASEMKRADDQAKAVGAIVLELYGRFLCMFRGGC